MYGVDDDVIETMVRLGPASAERVARCVIDRYVGRTDGDDSDGPTDQAAEEMFDRFGALGALDLAKGIIGEMMFAREMGVGGLEN
jgi:hypothetical protein